ncbi:probable cytochrome P450 6a21 [Musca autumnalis]|uniref:probable cytochrome P450 6a21 n=1 Tax=Musca autumnalis TaxID=221902 RepID=UPI003CF661FE
MIALTVLLSILLVLLVYIGHLLQRHFNYWHNLGIPCEPPNWFLGNLGGFTTTRSFVQIIREYYVKFQNSPGPFMGFYWMHKKAVFVMDPALIKQILIKDFHKFSDRGFFSNEDDDPLSGQLIKLSGNKWRNMRNKLSPAFTSGRMKVMFPLVIKLGYDLVRVVEERLANNSIVEVRDLVAFFTTDVIGTCAFGLDMNCMLTGDTEFLKMGHKALSEQRFGNLGFVVRFSFPDLCRRLHFKETLPEVEEYFMRIVKETVDYREQNNIRRNDFMDMLIDLKNNKLIKDESGDEFINLTFGQIAAQAFVFFLAGYETSSTTMSFALYELAQNIDIQQKAREEVLKILASHDDVLDYECLKEMVYLEQVVQETLRLYTTIPTINRLASEDYVVADNPKYVIKEGMAIVIPAAGIHRDERYFPQPNVFNPDHFTAEKVAERDPVLNLSFGDGPRNCIGMRFGKMQAMIGLALLLKNFRFTTCSETQIPLTFDKTSVIVAPESGIYLKVEKI